MKNTSTSLSTSPLIKKRLKEFQKACNRIRALISFKKITTWGAAFSELGLAGTWFKTEDKEPEWEATITAAEFNRLLAILEPRLVESWILELEGEDVIRRMQSIKTAIAKESYALEIPEPNWNERDFLLESPIPPPKEDKGLLRRQQLEQLIPPRHPAQKGECLYFQRDAALEAFEAYTKRGFMSTLLRANTGDGKTYFAGQLIRWLLDSGFFANKTVTPWKVLYVTGASITEQSREVLEKDFGLDCINEIHIANYEGLRSSFGIERFIEKELIITEGEEVEKWRWKKLVHPIFVLWDECHKLKNQGSTQSLIAQACNDINYIHPLTDKPALIYQCFMSASPFSRACHAKAFCVSTRHIVDMGYGKKRITNENWNECIRRIIHPGDPLVYSRANIRKLLKEFKPYIFTFKNVRRKHRAILRTEIIAFQSEQERVKYKKLWDEFVEFKQKIEGRDYANCRFLILVQLGVFKAGAELIRAPVLAKRAYEKLSRGYAPVIACGYKATIARIVLILTQDYNIPRSQISVIWGGSATLGKGNENKYTKEQIHAILKKALANPLNVNIKEIKSIHSQLKAEQDGLGDIPKELRLGIQSREARNEEREKFQDGRSLVCLFTFGAGKEGLSLHHNKENLRPRSQDNAPTWNEMEMLQAEGRTARITSLSDTEITTLLYENTVEIPVLRRVLAKRNCLDVVMGHGQKDGLDETYKKELDEVMKLAGLAETEEEDEELEEKAFEEMEDEISED